MYPRIVIDAKKLKHNMDALIAMGHEQGISIGLVSKCVCADAPIIELMNQTEADFIADSRLLNLKNIKTEKPKYLLRIAQACEAADVVAYSDISQQSELSTVNLIAEEAARQNKRHRIVLMVDMGDLREGVFYKNQEELLRIANAVKEAEMLGGLLENETMLRAQFQAEMAKQFPQMRCIAPYRDAAAGAVMLAKEIL